MINNFEDILQKKIKESDDIVKSFLPDEEGAQKTVISAMNYSVTAGGKRLRPLIMRECYRLLGGDSELEEMLLHPFMAAIEMIHTYSLVHDDLPAMDNDLLRRGKPTTHAAYGEAMAILAGDALLNYAFETIAGVYQRIPKSLELYERVMKAQYVCARNAGIYGMIGGQVMDIEMDNDTREDEQYLKNMCYMKTGGLIEISMMVGGILAGCDKLTAKKLEECAAALGLAFQIRDDILDETASEKELGKPIHSDKDNNKPTFLSVFGLDEAQRRVELYSKEAETKLEEVAKNDEVKNFLSNLFEYLVTRNK